MSAGVAATHGAKSDGPLKLAVPRGALFGETLDVLDGAGIDTSALRGDSRSLIFPGEEITLVTMRPSEAITSVDGPMMMSTLGWVSGLPALPIAWILPSRRPISAL